MILGSEPDAAPTSAADPGEATVELELTAAEQLELSQAAQGMAYLGASPPVGRPYDIFTCRRTARIDLVCTVTFVALILGVTVATGWHAIFAQPAASPGAISAQLAAAPMTQAAPAPPPVVQVVNPFDATEVFEFPPETTESEARDAIAELLLQRARERRQMGSNLRHGGNRNAPPVAAHNPAEMFVTRVPDPANPFPGILSVHP